MKKTKFENDALEKQSGEKERLSQEENEKQQKILDLMCCATNLHFEIEIRYETFRKKCSVKVDNLDDYEVLELKKHQEDFHLELRELIDKVSSFEKFVLPLGDLANEMRAGVTKMRDECTKFLNTILDDIVKVISARDISEKKMQNAIGLEIKLPKFKGYSSEIDIYTFRAEFKKLVEPFVQKRFWGDYLKKNCLEGVAFNLVAKVEDIDQIWKKLSDSFGSTRLMLQNKLGSLKKFNLDKLKDDEKIACTITSLLNVMADVEKLAEEYDLEGELYHGGGVHQILDLMGARRERRFIKFIAQKELKNPDKWKKLMEFLEDERKEREAYILNEKVKKFNFDLADREKEKKPRETDKKGYLGKKDQKSESLNYENDPSYEKCVCYICGKDEDHVLSWDSNRKPYIDYVACKAFVEKSPHERNKIIFKKRMCTKCLKPGVKWNSEHQCDNQYICNQNYVHMGNERKCAKHVLICGYHAKEKNNQELLEKYKKNVIMAHGKFFEFTHSISLSCFSKNFVSGSECYNGSESSVFAFQNINVAGLGLQIFFDSGCGDLVVRKDCVDKLMRIGRAVKEYDGPITLNGVGNQKSICPYGIYSIRIPLKDGTEAKMSGLCVDEVTLPFPKYPLKVVEQDIIREVGENDKDLLSKLPTLPNEVGGQVDIMIGKHYLRYFPLEIARLKSGLTLYNSMFKGADGSTGVVSGPHPEFSKIERSTHFSVKLCYYTPIVRTYFTFLLYHSEIPTFGYKKSFINPEVGSFRPPKTCSGDQVVSSNSHLVLPFSDRGDIKCQFDYFVGGVEVATANTFVTRRAPKCLKTFEVIENMGTNISYRCVDCRNCKECKKGSLIEEISIREEFEQSLINKSVVLKENEKMCVAHLPFLDNPDLKLVSNMKSARKVYNGVVKALAKSSKDKEDVLEAERKLQNLGFVDWLENLSKDDQNLILNGIVQYYIPWRVVWSNSVSTPVRPVFDASMRPPGGCSLNDILPKGSNNMNNLMQIIIRWFIKPFGYHTDISKCYNGVKIDRSHWRFQLYLFHNDLDPEKEPKTKVIKTCIYGVRPSGNQAERAIRMTAERYRSEYPLAYDIIQHDLYVDDCLSGEMTNEDRGNATEELRLCLGKAGFSLKGFTFSGQDLDSTLSIDGKSINVAGLKWFPKDDYLMFNSEAINFAQKVRGRKLENKIGLPDNLTMRDCVSLVAQVFDPTGRLTPIIAGFKLDISQLHRSGLKWDDEIPENLRRIWSSNYTMIKEINQLRYKRAIVPLDAKNLDIVTIDTGDSSLSLICSAIYARFEKKDGSFSCQLLLGRSKVLPEGITTPRGELMAAAMNAATGHSVKKALGKYHKKCIKLSDSTVALHWISSKLTVLKTWVRTRVVEINRLCDASSWFYVDTKDMVADIGTRKGTKIRDVDEGSRWISGLPWMSGPEGEFPTLTLEQIKISQQELNEANKETMIMKTFHTNQNAEVDSSIDEQIELRYMFSNYLIDPNKFRFRKVIRVFALVLKFVWEISKVIPKVRNNIIFKHVPPGGLADVLKFSSDRYIVTTGLVLNVSPKSNVSGKVVELSEHMLRSSMTYFSLKSSKEVKHFVSKTKYNNNKRNRWDFLLFW